jgi:hypothetical protein
VGRLAVAGWLLLVLAIAGCGSGGAKEAPRFFSSASVWNKPLAGDAPLDPSSAGLVSELERQVRTHGPWINSTQFSVPIYTVDKGAPGTSVHIDTPSDMFTGIPDATRLAQTLAGIPIPSNARPAAGTDRHLVIWQPSTDTMWELWMAHNPALGDSAAFHDNAPGWHASWGAKIPGVSRSSGVIPPPFGATASGLALAGGLVTNADLRAGRIEHALALSLPDTAQGRFVAPAVRTDGGYAGPNAIPEGTRFRLPANLDVDALRLPPIARMLAEAAKKYGIVVRDRAGSVAFYAQDPTPTGDPTLAGLLGGKSPAEVLAGFPWSRLEVVSPQIAR